MHTQHVAGGNSNGFSPHMSTSTRRRTYLLFLLVILSSKSTCMPSYRRRGMPSSISFHLCPIYNLVTSVGVQGRMLSGGRAASTQENKYPIWVLLLYRYNVVSCWWYTMMVDILLHIRDVNKKTFQNLDLIWLMDRFYTINIILNTICRT